MAAVMRRTWRFLPSMSARPIQQVGTGLRKRIGGSRGATFRCGSSLQARQGSVSRAGRASPSPSFSSAAGVGIHWTCAQYSRGWAFTRDAAGPDLAGLPHSERATLPSRRRAGPGDTRPLGKPKSARVRFGEPSGVKRERTPQGLLKAISMAAKQERRGEG